MTGGQGCASQCTGKDDTGVCNFTTPMHCPGQTDAEYRTEFSLYTVVASPLMIGTDIRLMTPIMKELILNPEAIAINQDWEAPPGDAVAACRRTAAAGCALAKQVSHSPCTLGTTFGCDANSTMWVSDGCRGVFSCDGVDGVQCGRDTHGKPTPSEVQRCPCAAPSPQDPGDVWIRKLTSGNFAVAMPNLGAQDATLRVCFDAIGWPHGAAVVRDVWARTELGRFEGSVSLKVATHDTRLLLLRPA